LFVYSARGKVHMPKLHVMKAHKKSGNNVPCFLGLYSILR